MKFDPKFFTGKSQDDLIPFHPEADRFPMMWRKEFDHLVTNIKESGLQEPIVHHEGKILDGRNRYLACLIAGVAPIFVEFEGKDLVDFVFAMNAHRRHLTTEHKLDVVARLVKEFPERSNRSIADLAQVHHKTVGRVREAQEGRGAERHVEMRVDTAGRTYPVRKARRSALPAIPLTDPDDAEPESWVDHCASGLGRGDINRNINEILRILDKEKKRIAAFPKAWRAALARRSLGILDLSLEDLKPIDSVPDCEDGFGIGAHMELSDEHT